MKYLRVKIARSDNPGGGTHYDYPPQYDPKKVKHISYETFNEKKIANVKARPTKHEFCIIAVEDIDAVNFLLSPDIEEIDEATFNTEGDDNTGDLPEYIEDEQEVLRVLGKVVKGQPLNPVDLDAIDGTKPGKGIKKGKKFSETWAERKAELGV